MATYYKFLDDRSKMAGKFPLKIAISHKKKTTYIQTGYYLIKKEWDPGKKKITSKYKNSGSANAKVDKKYAIVGEIVESLRPYWKELNVGQIKEAAEEKINEEFQEKFKKEAPKILNAALNSEKADATCFYEYAGEICKQYYRNDQGGSATCIEGTIKSLTKFTGKDRLPIKQIDEAFLISYEKWYVRQLNDKGELNTINGFGFKAKDIRLIFNRAAKDKKVEDVTRDMYCFGHSGYSIKKEKTDNKNVDPSEIAKIFDLELPSGSRLWHHLNYFKYYFECWGMNWADIAYLRVYQVQNGRLKYRRRKTKWSNNAKKFDIGHSPIAQEIIDYYTRSKKPSDFVFPLIADIFYLNDEQKDKELEAANKKLFQNKFNNRRSSHIRRLKTISKNAGLKENVSIYVGRHSFFSIALRSGVSKSEISELAGHSNYQVTESYLAGFDGEQLALSANMVRTAVAKYTSATTDNGILDDIIILSVTGTQSSVSEFLTKAWSRFPNETKTPTNLLIKFLQKTNCQDGIKAQEYVNAFLLKQELGSKKIIGRKVS